MPTVLTREEALSIIAALSGTNQLIARLLYGSGLRLLEALTSATSSNAHCSAATPAPATLSTSALAVVTSTVSSSPARLASAHPAAKSASTTDDLLWPFFHADRSLLRILLKTAAQAICELLNDLHPGLRVGLVYTVYPAGRGLGFKPHIHVVIAKGGLKDDKWVEIGATTRYPPKV